MCPEAWPISFSCIRLIKEQKYVSRTFSTRRHLAGVPQAAYVSVTPKNRVGTCPQGKYAGLLGEGRCSIFTNNISFTLSKFKSCTSKMYLSSMSCVDEYIFLLGKETV